MKRSTLLAALLVSGGISLLAPLQRNRAAAADTPPIPATRYYPLTIGNKWDYSFKRVTSISFSPTEGDATNFSLTSEGTQTVEVTKEDGERSGDQGKVFVQRTTELGKVTGGSTADQVQGDADQQGPRLVGEAYFRVNPRGVWLISDGEADDKGEAIEKVTDRRLPLLWVPTDLKPNKSWTITCQIDPMITARITTRVGKAQTLKVNGATYDNCLPVVSIAEKMNGRLDMGGALAPIREGRIVDVTYYAPQIGIVKGHQLANFTLEPPNPRYSAASAHFEESIDLQPSYKVSQ